MYTNKIYCFGDGYAHGHIWPEWPQILEALLPEYEIKVISGIGAGPEYLVTQFSKLLPVDGQVIFQWPMANRFDKIIQDEYWDNILSTDPVYSFNTYTHEQDTWWLSSASKSDDIKEYHLKFVQTNQAIIRLNVYRSLVKEILDKSGYRYVFTSTDEQEEFNQNYLSVRGNEIQPSPLSHFYFLIEKIMPALNLTSYNHTALEHLLTACNWIPYDPDRTEIWQTIKTQLKNNNNK